MIPIAKQDVIDDIEDIVGELDKGDIAGAKERLRDISALLRGEAEDPPEII